MIKENLCSPDFKDQIRSNLAHRRPPPDPDGPLVDADDATRAPTVSGETSTVLAETVEPFPFTNDDNDILTGDVSIRIQPPSPRTTLADNPYPSPSASSPGTRIPLAFFLPDADAADAPNCNIINNNDMAMTMNPGKNVANNNGGKEATTPKPTNQDQQQKPFPWTTALVLASFTIIALAVIVAIAVVCPDGGCSGGGGGGDTPSTPTDSGNTPPPPPSAGTTASPTTKGSVPAPAPLPVVSPAPTMRDRAKAITNFINSKSYTSTDLSLSGTLPEDRAMQWLIHDDPLQLNVGGDERDEFRLLQRYSLMTLWFQGNTGTAWSTSTNWTNADECTWHRIRCKAGIVQSVLLSYLALQGTLSPDLGLLTDLTRLQLNSNKLSGSLPTEIGFWTSLTSFIVYGNSITGSLPTEIGLWTSLASFDVGSNSIAGTIPETIANWSLIEDANFAGNDFTGSMPDGICEFISETGDLVADTGLECSCCTAVPVPAPLPVVSTAPTTRARALDITNYINSKSYTGIDLSLSGTLPEERAMQWLIDDDPLQLNVGDEGDEFRLLQRYSLLTFWFQGDTGTAWIRSTNWLSADECTWFRIKCNMAGVVQRVRLFDLQLQGTLSPDLGLLTDLTRLDLDFNNLSGSLPSQIGLWTSLTFFDVWINSLTGRLPSEIGSWVNLTYFDVDENSLTGPLPSEIGSWTNLKTFYASGNGLTGPLPSEIGSWTSLIDFVAWGNGLTGPLPSEIGSWKNLFGISVTDNSLTGPLPSEIGLWTSLDYFYADMNDFTGPLPSEIGLWTNLFSFFVNSNSFTGTIPETIANWKFIFGADFTDNNFTGSMPESICEIFDPSDGFAFLVVDCEEVSCSCCTDCV